MSRSRLFILAALVLLMAAPSGAVFAQEEEAVAMGTAVIYDDLNLSDAITYAMTNVTLPEDGKSLVGWLIDDRDGTKFSTGPMTVDEDGTLGHTFDSTHPRYTGANLIHTYNRVVITLEESDVDQPAGSAVFEDAIEGGVITHVRHLVTNWPEGSVAGILTNLKNQIQVAIDHANLVSQSVTLAQIQSHTRHVINIIEGTDGPNFDESAGNPGDGLGVLLHAGDRSHAALAAAGLAADDLVAVQAELVEITGMNAETSAIAARDGALQVLAQNDRDLAKILIGPVLGYLEQALNGRDADADGIVASIEGEGAVVNAYIEAQRMATYTFEAGATTAPAPPPEEPSVGDATVPMLARIALIASVLLLGMGGLVLVGRFRRLTT
jgi:hypothetical protein